MAILIGADVGGSKTAVGVSEGGDVLAQRMRRDPAFAAGMTRVCEGGGVALYRRVSDRTAGRR